MAKSKNQTVIILVVIVVIVMLFFIKPQTNLIFSTAPIMGSSGSTPVINEASKLIIFAASGNCKIVGEDEYCCDDPAYPVLCEDNSCGPTQGYCNNLNSGGGHCKQSDPSWCCYDSGYVVCNDNADICGTPSFCDTYNSPDSDKSCYNGQCCSGANPIIDYACMDSGVNTCCCPAASPFVGNNYQNCYTTPQPGDRNWYTNQNQCSPSDNSCEGTDYKECILAGFIYQLQNKGAVKDKCGVQCTINECNGLNTLSCQNYQKTDIGIVLNSCGVECFNNTCEGKKYVVCNNYKKDTGTKYGDKSSVSGSGYYVGLCGVQCTEDSCSGRDYILCENYVKINKGETVGKCGDECLGNESKAGYYCVSNKWITSKDYQERNYQTYYNMYRFANNSCNLIKLHLDQMTDFDYLDLEDCQSNQKNVFTYTKSDKIINVNMTVVEPITSTSFVSRIGGFIFILVIAGIIIFWLWRRKK